LKATRSNTANSKDERLKLRRGLKEESVII